MSFSHLFLLVYANVALKISPLGIKIVSSAFIFKGFFCYSDEYKPINDVTNITKQEVQVFFWKKIQWNSFKP